MYKKSWLTYLRDVVCWIPISVVHLFKLVSSCFGNRRYCDLWTLKLINDFLWSVSLRVKLSFEWRLSPGFGTQKKCPFPRNGGVPTTELTNSKIMWTFFRDQILSPLNGDVPWTEVSQRRGSTVSIFLSCGKKRMVSLRCSGQETKILNEKYIMQYIK